MKSPATLPRSVRQAVAILHGMSGEHLASASIATAGRIALPGERFPSCSGPWFEARALEDGCVSFRIHAAGAVSRYTLLTCDDEAAALVALDWLAEVQPWLDRSWRRVGFLLVAAQSGAVRLYRPP